MLRALRLLYDSMQDLNPQDMASSLWGLATLGVQPDGTWLGLFSAHATGAAQQFKPREITNTIWAYARLLVRPSRELMDALFVGTDHRLSNFKPKELTSILWALSRLRMPPQKEWRDQFLQATFHKMGSLGPQVPIPRLGGGWGGEGAAQRVEEVQHLPAMQFRPTDHLIKHNRQASLLATHNTRPPKSPASLPLPTWTLNLPT
jgi:hypothetical protein